MCLNAYNKNRRKPLITVDYIENLSDSQDLKEETISETVERDLFKKCSWIGQGSLNQKFKKFCYLIRLTKHKKC